MYSLRSPVAIPPKKLGVCFHSQTRKGSFFLRHSTTGRCLFDYHAGFVLTGSDSFHPSIQRVKAIIDSGELGALKEVNATLAVPKGLFGEDNIRLNYDLGGGAMMDCGCQFTPFNYYELPLTFLLKATL